MDDLLQEMHECKTVQACIDLALTDAYGEEEEAVAWLTCIETMFGRIKEVKLLGDPVQLTGFALDHHSIVAVCRRGKDNARATLDSLEFLDLKSSEMLWLKAWQRYSSCL